MPSPDIRVIIAADEVDPDAEAAAFRRAHAESGAVAYFVGQVRAERGAVEALTLEQYDGFTQHAIEKIAADAASRWPLDGLLVIHRVGVLKACAPIVFVAAAAAHRRAAFDAVDFMVDYLKTEAPLWKRERSTSGDAWIEPTAEDHAGKARWRSKVEAD
jgi:molybdopterin synthase catalytic subunit